MAAFSIIGIVVSQIYWVSKAWSLRENQFSHRVDLALNDVFNRIVTINRDTTLMVNPVSRISNSQYVVELNHAISLPVLEALLVSAFEKTNVNADFEYGVYDCIADTSMVGKYVMYDSTFISRPNPLQNIELPSSPQTYFGVYFPEKQAYLINSMGFWFFSSAILLVVIIFFAYTTFVILRQKRMSEVTRDFINNMTHELKTPVSTISVSANVL
jgi:two-component system phosphate regulon sensor histidine kinase PhoR